MSITSKLRRAAKRFLARLRADQYSKQVQKVTGSKGVSVKDLGREIKKKFKKK